MDYAATLSVAEPDEGLLDAFEDAIDRLTEGSLVGSVDAGYADLLFTVHGSNVIDATRYAAAALARVGVPAPPNARLRVERHGASDSVTIGSETIRRHQGELDA